MEHVFLPYDAQLSEVDVVPYVADEHYQGVPFLEYLSTFDLEEKWISLALGTTEEAERIYQTWHCFCFLQEVLGPFFDHDDYVEVAQNSNGETTYIVTMKQLNHLLGAWLEYVKEHPHELKTRDHYNQCFDTAGSYQPRSPLIRRSIRNSVIAIHQVTAIAIDSALGVIGVAGHSVREMEVSDEDLHIMVNEMSWCPFQAARAWEDALNINTQMLIRSLRRPRPNKEHANCTQRHCEVAQIKPETFVLSHATVDCECDELFSTSGETMQCYLEDGQIPMIKVTYNSHAVLDAVDMVARTEGMPYIALSHVWADGLGNPLANSVRKCQFDHLCAKLLRFSKTTISSSSDTFYFWLDTLCVPVTLKEAKLLAITRMQDVYQDAAHVLVLDRDLQLTNFDENCILIPSIFITTSQWVWRLWTLQEALLANRLWFRFKDQSIEISELKRRLREEMSQAPGNQYMIYIDILEKIQGLRLHARKAWTDEYDLELVRHAVQYRGVSVPADEALCLATLTDVKIDAEERYPGDRMSRFWVQYGNKYNIGNETIFHDFPRLQIPGFGWAPSTLLRSQTPLPFETCHFTKPGHAQTQITAQGIKVFYPGFMLESASSIFSVQDIFKRAVDLKLFWVNIFDETSGNWFNLIAHSTMAESICKRPSRDVHFSKLNSDQGFAVILNHNGEGPDERSLVTKVIADEHAAIMVHTISPSTTIACIPSQSRVMSQASSSCEEEDITLLLKERAETDRLFGAWKFADDMRTQEQWEEALFRNLMEKSYFVVRRRLDEDQAWIVD